tara:strand:+ start:720 stop:1385 length:666 start_codon:yes stop_codon:yes gene_type:complete
MSGIIGKREVRGSGVVNRDITPVKSVSGSIGVVADSDIDHDSLTNFASNEHYTQANITALGTVTSGNISHADIVFPAGHVIQTVTDTYDAGSAVTTSSTTFVATPMLITITPTSASNHMIWTFVCNGFTSNSASYDLIADIQRSINGGSYTQYAHTETFAYGHHYGVHYPKPATLIGDDKDITGWSTGTIVYKIFIKIAGSSGQLLREDTSNFMMVQEIKR